MCWLQPAHNPALRAARSTPSPIPLTGTTVMVAVLVQVAGWQESLLAALTVAELVIEPVAVGVPLMVTVAVAPTARSPRLQRVAMQLPTEGVTVQEPPPSRPLVVRARVTVEAAAAPLFFTATTNEASVPTATLEDGSVAVDTSSLVPCGCQGEENIGSWMLRGS